MTTALFARAVRKPARISGGSRLMAWALIGLVIATEGAIAWLLSEFITTGRMTVNYVSAALNVDALQGARDLDRLLTDTQRAAESHGSNDARYQSARARLVGWFNEEERLAVAEHERQAVARTRTAILAYLDTYDRTPGVTSAAEPTRIGTAHAVDEMIYEVAALRTERTRSLFLSHVERLRRFRLVETVFVSLLIPLGAMAAWMAYRKWLMPLRARLIESERLLEQREKLAALGTLAAGVAHEINNPLTAIKARLYTLRKQLAPSLDAQKGLKIVSGEIDRLEGIARGMLAFARPSEPQFSVVAAREFLQEVAEFFKPASDWRGAQLIVKASESVPVWADPGQLRQIVINLVRNALEASEEREVTITLAASLAAVLPSGRSQLHAVLSVTDDGPGIPAAVQVRLFDPFFTTKRSGTGLGLSIVQQLVDKHGGEIAFDSRVGKGTCFEVHLPMGDTRTA